MTVLDIGNNVTIGHSLEPLARTGSSEWFDGAAVDTQGVTWAVAVFYNGAIASSTIQYRVRESDTSGGTFTTCKQLNTTDDAETTAATLVANSTQVIAIDCRNTKRWLKLSVSVNNTATNANAGLLILMPNYTGDADAPSFDI